MPTNQFTMPRSPQFQNVTGQRFNLLTVLSYAGTHTSPKGSVQQRWRCRCACGEERVVMGCNLGRTISCGCYSIKVHVKHGHTRKSAQVLPEYCVWVQMHARCRNPKTRLYRRYGGRGITVCGRWANFENFLMDMGRRPSSIYSLERVNNNKGYEPTNCKWATRAEQNRNKVTNRFLTYDGKTMCFADWAHKLKIPRSTFSYRMDHWPLERVFSTPF